MHKPKLKAMVCSEQIRLPMEKFPVLKLNLWAIYIMACFSSLSIPNTRDFPVVENRVIIRKTEIAYYMLH